MERPGLGLPQLVQTVMEGFADRPALGQRAVRLVKDPDPARAAVELLLRFETITYWESCLQLLASRDTRPDAVELLSDRGIGSVGG